MFQTGSTDLDNLFTNLARGQFLDGIKQVAKMIICNFRYLCGAEIFALQGYITVFDAGQKYPSDILLSFQDADY